MPLFRHLWRTLLILSLTLNGQSHAWMAMPTPASVVPAAQAQVEAQMDSHMTAHCADSPAHSDHQRAHAHQASGQHMPIDCGTHACHCAGAHCTAGIVGASTAGGALRQSSTVAFIPTRYGSPLLAPSLRPPIS